MKKVLLITIFLLLQSFPSVGELNGKRLICECKTSPLSSCEKEKGYEKYLYFDGYKFENNKIIKDYYSKLKDKIILSNVQITYSTNTTFIKWKSIDKFQSYTLDRKNLKINKHDLVLDWKYTYQCKLISNSKEYDLKLKKMKIEFQNLYNKKMKENKI